MNKVSKKNNNKPIKLKLPFTINPVEKTKSFKILNGKELHGGFLNFIKQFITPTKKITDSNKLIYVKGSSTKEYYKKINSKK